MSLAREALRIATVRALRGKTWVEDRVRDSEQGPIDDRAAAKTLPEVIVYTDDGKFGDGNRDLFAGGVTHLVIEIVITQRMKVSVEGGEGDEEWEWNIPQTDAAMELTLGMIERQVKVALVDPASAWGEMWRTLALTVGECTSQRGTAMREGVRFAGRQLILPVHLAKDPTPGQPLTPLWSKFLALVDATADLEPMRKMIRAMIEGGPSDWPDWVALRSAFGLTLDEARALQLAPPAAAEGTSPDIASVATETTVGMPTFGPLP